MAWLIRIAILLAGTAVVIWAWFLWNQAPHNMLWWIGGGLILPWLMLLPGMLAARLLNRRTSLTGIEFVRGWFGECLAAFQAACWTLPFASRKFSDLPTDGSSETPVVILVHGFVCNRGVWNRWLRQLSEQRIDYIAVNLEPLFGSIDAYVPLIQRAMVAAESRSSYKPIFICHSMGGLAVRRWLIEHPDAYDRIERIVTLGTPHFGTWLGWFTLAINGQQMRVGSRWIARLAKLEKERRGESAYDKFISWYSNLDNVVLPNSSSRLPGAENRPLRGYGHLALLHHPEVMKHCIVQIKSRAE